nr:hypothetical protein [Aureimonas populi]
MLETVEFGFVNPPPTVGDENLTRAFRHLGGRVAEEPFGRSVPEDDLAFRIRAYDGVGRRRGDVLEPGLADGPHIFQPADFHTVHHQRREVGEVLAILGRKFRSRLAVDETDGAELFAGRRDQRLSGVKADEGRAEDERIGREARILGRIGDEQDVVLNDGVSAERDLAAGLADIETDMDLEELPVALDERDQHDGTSNSLDANAASRSKSSSGGVSIR